MRVISQHPFLDGHVAPTDEQTVHVHAAVALPASFCFGNAPEMKTTNLQKETDNIFYQNDSSTKMHNLFIFFHFFEHKSGYIHSGYNKKPHI